MRSTALPALLACACLVACADPVAAPDAGPPDAGPPADASPDATAASDAGLDPGSAALLDELARALCDAAIRCEAGAGRRALENELACHPGAPGRVAIERAVAAGLATLDAAAARACIDALGPGVWCDAIPPSFVFPDPWSCPGLVVGRIAIDQPCQPPPAIFSPLQPDPMAPTCVPEAHCEDAPACGARCVADLGEGGACLRDLDCVSPLACLEGSCRRLPARSVAGDRCAEDRDCAPLSTGLYCESGACTALDPVALGGDCSRIACAAGLVCIGGACADPASISCAWDSQCDAWRAGYCGRDSACHTVIALGAPCDPREPSSCGILRSCADVDGAGFRCAESFLGASCRMTDPALGTAPDECPVWGLTCTATPSAPAGWGACRREVRVDDARCDTSSDCGAKRRCVSGSCREIVLPGESCLGGAQCPLTSACVEGVCVPRPMLGEACDAARPCLEGACLDGTCAWLAPGEACVDDPASLGTCEHQCSGFCDTPLAEGEFCFPGDDGVCAGELVCRLDEIGETHCLLPCGY